MTHFEPEPTMRSPELVPPPPSPEIIRLAEEADRLREGHGDRQVETLNLDPEKRELTEAHESIFGSMLERVKDAMNFLVLQPAAWLGNLVKDHPFKTALIALAAFALWYYALPLSAGLSAFAEEGLHLTSQLLTKLIDIDPTSINVFTDLFKEIPNGPSVG
mgnify:CR=1 FL=1